MSKSRGSRSFDVETGRGGRFGVPMGGRGLGAAAPAPGRLRVSWLALVNRMHA